MVLCSMLWPEARLASRAGVWRLYDFKQLSPADFEDLTRDLLQQHWNVRIEAFKAGRDDGIDLRYAAVPSQSVVVQCKHFAGSTVAKLLRELRTSELPKVIRLHPDRYVLVTSLPLSPRDKDKLTAVLQPYVQTTHDILGAGDLNNLLGCHPTIESQHFKLWMSSTAVLQSVLHNAVRVQTEFDVQRVLRAMPLYVQTGNYASAMKILKDHNVVIISGVPGIGKTTLADMLLFTHMEAGYQPIVIKSDIKEGKDLFRGELRQVFYFDDFLGEAFLGNRFDFLGKREDSAILNFVDQVARSKHSKFILTTREHILRHAVQISEHFRRRRRDLAEQQFVLELTKYTLVDRARILYNHIYFSDLARPYKAALLRGEFYMRVLKHRNFNPRLVEWLSRFTNVKRIPPAGYQKEVERVLENPEELWRIAFEQQISESSRSFLLALYSLGGTAHLDKLIEVWQELHQHRAQKYNWKRGAEDSRQALYDLEGGFLVYQNRNAAFVNPSVNDFFHTTLTTDVEHLNDLLATANRFEQVVTIWSLVTSEKGAHLRAYFRQFPHGLVDAINRNASNPHEQRIDFKGGAYGTRPYDARPEVRLLTMISITDYTRSWAMLQAVIAYTEAVITFWSTYPPDISAASDALRALDSAEWNELRRSDLHAKLKEAALNELVARPDSGSIAAISDYAESATSRWNRRNQQVLKKSFERYLVGEFDVELADAASEYELDGLESRLTAIANWCGVSIYRQSDLIRERISEIDLTVEEDEQSVRPWESDNQLTLDRTEEEEVRRLFSGLPYAPRRRAGMRRPE